MSRSLLVAAFAGLVISALGVAPATLRAQSADPAKTLPPVQAAVLSDDSLYYAAGPTRLATVMIMAEAEHGRYDGIRGRIRAREDIRSLTRENRSLSIQLARYDRKIEQLETRLNYLKTVVTDSLLRQTAQIDATTASVRARRLELEKRLMELEAKNAVPVLASTPADSTTAKKANE